jgi:hypothetical protein
MSLLAHCNPVTLVTPPNFEQPQIQDATPELQEVIAAARQNLGDAESTRVRRASYLVRRHLCYEGR